LKAGSTNLPISDLEDRRDESEEFTRRVSKELTDVYYATFILVDFVGPPSAEFCRIAENFPQMDDLRFINLWEV
jgi:hypothetical protein